MKDPLDEFDRNVLESHRIIDEIERAETKHAKEMKWLYISVAITLGLLLVFLLCSVWFL